MKLIKTLFILLFISLSFTNCKKTIEKQEVVKENNIGEATKTTIAISGMTCEIGCAKYIQSKLSKKEGVLNAQVVFKDSIANIEFDAKTTSKEDLISYVNELANGEQYKASIVK